MAKHYKYVNGKRLVVVNNYELGSDVIPEEVNLIPDITQADEGKVLMADENGEPKWTSIPSQLPALTDNAGKVLKVNSGATGVEWGEESTELPSLTGNADKVLTVNSAGTGVEWATPSGGSSVGVIRFTYSDNVYHTTTTFSEVEAMRAANMPIIVIADQENSYSGEVQQTSDFSFSPSTQGGYFICTFITNSLYIEFNKNNEITHGSL